MAQHPTVPAFNPHRDPMTGVLNVSEIVEYSRSLAAAVQPILQADRFPIVLGGDCSRPVGK